jgi:hypothetical protein
VSHWCPAIFEFFMKSLVSGIFLYAPTEKGLRRTSWLNTALCLLNLFFFIFWNRVSLCSPAWLQTCNPPASACWVLGL